MATGRVLRHNSFMDQQHGQHDQPQETSAAGAPSRNMRVIAIAVTALALLAISIPFVWQPHAESTDAAPSAAVTPAASHEPAGADTAACMADAKPANWDFKLKDLAGKEVSLASFKDSGKVVLLNFWATWCGPCKAEIPGFVELQEKYKDKLTIIGYSVDDTAELAKKYADEYKMNYPILLGEGREDVQDAYGPIWGIPASFIISREGKVCKKHLGIAPKAVFEREIKALL
jgi:thiol-disulfide isomerase/thioredoxin